MSDAIRLIGQVYKVQTLVDGGIRLTIDLPESAAEYMGQLAHYQINGIMAGLEIKPEPLFYKQNRDGKSKRQNKQP